MPKRVVFTFDDRSFDNLERMKAVGRYPSLANAVRDSLQITRAIQSQREQGFTELIVRNPRTGVERILIIPELNKE
jgi:hypothetical protein